MTINTGQFKDVTNGYEKRTDGLWVHRGKLSAGLPGTAPVSAGDINANRGDGTGVYYFAGRSDRYLYYDGANYQLPGAPLWATTQVLRGEYFSNPAWTTPGSGAWYETPLQVTVTHTGKRLRIEYSLNVYNNTAGVDFRVGIGINGTVLYALADLNASGTNYAGNVSGTFYTIRSATTERCGIFMYSVSGLAGISANAYSTLYVTEQFG